MEEGLEAALERKPSEKPPREVRFDGAFEARLIALACSEAPKGRYKKNQLAVHHIGCTDQAKTTLSENVAVTWY